MAIKITGTTVINDSRGIENISDVDQFVRKPTITSPTEGSTTDAGLSPTIVGSVYAPFFSADARNYREFQVDLATGDFSSPIRTNQVNADSWSVSPFLDANTEHKIRIRDVSNDGVVSEFSDEVTFTTGDAFVAEPTVSVEGSPSNVPENPQINTSSFFVEGGETDTHQSTDWEVIRTSDSVVVFSSIGDTSNLTSITVTTNLNKSEEYEFRARHNGVTFGASSFGSTTALTSSFFTALGDSFCGGFYMGAITAAGTCYALIVAPNATGCVNGCQWKTSQTTTSGACSDTDGYANTYTGLDNLSHPAGNWTATRTIGGFSDWYLPAIDELDVFYNNGGGNGAGDPLPSGEDFATCPYWSSTERGFNDAYTLTFYGYGLGDPRKTNTFRVRAVRRVPI